MVSVITAAEDVLPAVRRSDALQPGAIACKILDQLGIKILTYTKSIGDITADPACFDRSVIMENPFYMPDADAAKKAGEFLEECMKNEDSSGGSIECVIQNMPAGIGEPVFEKLSANLGKAILSIGAVKAFEIGDGTAVAHALGHTNNDQYTRDPDGKIIKLTNPLRRYPGRHQRRK